MNDISDLVYDGIAAFAAELVRGGVTEVVISPGSRSTPLAVTLHAHPGLRTWIQLDERSGGFFALGLGRATGVPAVLVCTSGTAAANYLPAVVEAHHGGVPLIACTADRPPELRDRGAGQTIDQVSIYGRATRWAADLPVAGEIGIDHFRVAAMRAVSAATGADPGPVHLNWPLREPLEPTSGVPVVSAERRDDAADTGDRQPVEHNPIYGLSGRERGVVIVGPPTGTGLSAECTLADQIHRFAAAVGWPVIGEAMTHLRRDDTRGSLVGGGCRPASIRPRLRHRHGSRGRDPHRPIADHQAGSTLAGAAPPRQGGADRSFRALERRQLHPDRPSAPRAGNGPHLGRIDPACRARGSRHGDRPRPALRPPSPAWSTMGRSSPPAVTRTLVRSLPTQSVLMVSNSMPVRDMDTFSGGDLAPIVVGNRGASGIDGINSTALGLAAAQPDRSAALFTGDLALLHDLGGLLAAVRLDLHLTVVCIDNDGGAIFSMLPIADRGADVDFETLFRTPHGLELVGLDGFGGVRARLCTSATDLADAIRDTMTVRAPGVDMLIVPVDPGADLAQHRAVSAAVSASIVSDAS